MERKKIETCFSPAIYSCHEDSEAIVVIIDVLRASSAICTAFANGAVSIIPVGEISEALEYKKKGYLVAAERDGYVLDFADFGNSPFNFTKDRVEGRTIVYSTTNGTKIIKLASHSFMTVIGSFLNLEALTSWLIAQGRDVLLFCAGWKDRFSLEDTVCAGAMAERIIENPGFSTICDSTIAAIDLWRTAKNDLHGYIEKAAQRSRLGSKGLDDCIGFCLTSGFTDMIPYLKNGILAGKIAAF